jgi:putative peptidoglycan lipid II flippase
MNTPYDRDRERDQPADPRRDPRQDPRRDPQHPDDAYTRETYASHRPPYPGDDAYLGVDELLTHAEQRDQDEQESYRQLPEQGQPEQPQGGPQPDPAQQPYDPRSGGYGTAQFMAGEFDQTQYPSQFYDQAQYQAPAQAPPQMYDQNQVYDQDRQPPPSSAPYAPYTPPPGAPYQQQPAPGPGYGAPPPYPQTDPLAQPAQPAPPPAAPDRPDLANKPAPQADSGSRASGILKSSALMAAGTMVSRLLGFVRNLVIAAAIGFGALGDSYGTANSIPTMLYFLVGGGALNAVFVPQLARAMRNNDAEGEAYANRLLTLVMTVLAVLVVAALAAAPILAWLISPTQASAPNRDTTVAFTRYLLPIIFFTGVHVVIGQILNVKGRFGAMMWTPVLNNIIIIATFGLFILVYGPWSDTHMTTGGVGGIPSEGVRLLGIGTLLGLVVQALAMLPYLKAEGFRFRPRFDWKGQGLGKAARLAKWTFLFVLANQAGLLVTTQLSTKAAADAGLAGTGLSAYQNALLIWQLPQAVITVSVMTAVLPRISRAAHDNDAGAVRDDLSYGLRTSAVAIVPCAFLMLALGPQIGGLLFGSGAGESAAKNVGYILMAFALGLIPFSANYVLLRGFYAYEDTKTPFFNTVWVALASAALAGLSYLVLPSRWAVVGMAAGYGMAYLLGTYVAAARLQRRLGDLDGRRVLRTYLRLCTAAAPAAVAAYLLGLLITGGIGWGLLGTLSSVAAGSLVFLLLFVLAGKALKVDEMTALVGMVRSKLGR